MPALPSASRQASALWRIVAPRRVVRNRAGTGPFCAPPRAVGLVCAQGAPSLPTTSPKPGCEYGNSARAVLSGSVTTTARITLLLTSLWHWHGDRHWGIGGRAIGTAQEVRVAGGAVCSCRIASPRVCVLIQAAPITTEHVGHRADRDRLCPARVGISPGPAPMEGNFDSLDCP